MTLIELMLALMLTAGVLLAAAMMLDQLNDGGERIARARVLAAREGNGARLLRRLLLEAEPPPDSTHRFVGDERLVAARTRCETSRGWTRRCQIQLAIDSLGDSSLISLELDGARIPLKRLSAFASFRFLNPSSRDSAWVRTWTSTATLPAALAIVGGADTIVMSVGPARD